jgi:pSer/pThr/pTyr-binding forkhead associated (FHA) protein
MAMEARLTVMGPWSAGEQVVQSALPVTIGRGAAADVQVTDAWVSRLHCRIDEIDGELIVRDLGSRHGTLVNGEHISEHVLAPGDEIILGTTRLRITREEDDEDSLVGAGALAAP